MPITIGPYNCWTALLHEGIAGRLTISYDTTPTAR